MPGKSHGQRRLAGYSPWVTKSQTWLSDYTTTTTNMSLSKKTVVAEKVMLLCKFLMKLYIFYY